MQAKVARWPGWLLGLHFGFGILAAATPQEFESASVKVCSSTPAFPRMEGGPGSRSPTRIRYEGATLRQLLIESLGVYSDQIVGPGWITTQLYSVNATLPPNSTKADFQAMMLDLVTTRFHVGLRSESKEFTVYELVIAEGGHRMRQTAAAMTPEGGPADDSPVPIPPDSIKLDVNGCPIIPAGKKAGIGDSRSNCMSYRQMTMADIVPKIGFMLAAESGALFGPQVSSEHIADKTGLTGAFDFELRYDFGSRMMAGVQSRGYDPNQRPEGDDLAQALRRQLGLKLVKSRTRLPVFVVEHAEKIPTPN
jgi:uncharacterized protein (TIGR03435 family)